MDVPAVVVTYDHGWPGLFLELRDRVDIALADIAHVTEHVGSTAVPGLDAKPIIDMDVVVPDQVAVGPAIAWLGAAGWRHQGDLGIERREAFAPPADAAYHHLYVVVAGSQPHRDHVDLRDFLRAHPAQAARYGELKHRLAGLLATDRLAYGEGKAEMIAEFLHQARTSPSQSLPTGDSIRESPLSLTASMAHWAGKSTSGGTSTHYRLWRVRHVGMQRRMVPGKRRAGEWVAPRVPKKVPGGPPSPPEPPPSDSGTSPRGALPSLPADASIPKCRVKRVSHPGGEVARSAGSVRYVRE